MKYIVKRRFEIHGTDFLILGAEVERLLESIKKHKYGFYNTDHVELKTKLAFKLIEGMEDWQWQHNKGIRVRGDLNIKVEIYELHELNKEIEESLTIDFFGAVRTLEDNKKRACKAEKEEEV